MIQKLPDPDAFKPESSHSSSTDSANLFPPYHRPNDPTVIVPASRSKSSKGRSTDAGNDAENQPSESDPRETFAGTKKKSLRTRRRNFTAACTAFTLGAIMIIGSSPLGKEILVPGPLSPHHAPLVAGEGADRCAACHANANGSLGSWIAAAFVSAKKSGLSQSELCMKCHDQSLAKNYALNPHNVALDELSAMTAKYEQTSFDAGMLFHPPVNENNELACSVCHQEHHGGDELKTLTDAQCQSCHSNTFHSFETDHPEFVRWPQRRRSRIAFDHSTHAAQHFPGKQTEFNCNQCHVDDDFQNVKKLASFEQSCADCHNQQIQESNSQGLELIALPMIDMDAIEAEKLKVGNWPLAATGDFDGAIPPMMRLMLAADEKASLILNRLGANFDFSDIDPANASDVNDAVHLVWAIKRLLNDLSLDGPRAIQLRLESVLGFEISDEQLQRIITNLDEPVFQNAVRRWLPDLSAEVAWNRFGSGGDGGQRVVDSSKADLRIPISNISWRPSADDVLANIADENTLLANNPVSGLMGQDAGKSAHAMGANVGGDTSRSAHATGERGGRRAANGASTARPALPIVRVPDGNTQATNSDRIAQAPSQRKTVGSKLNSGMDWRNNAHANSDGDLLAVNPLPGLMSGKPASGTSGAQQTALPKIKVPERPTMGMSTNSQIPPKSQQSTNPGKSPLDNSDPTFPAVPVPLGSNKGMAGSQNRDPLIVPSGWFRNDTTFRISYRPSGHADDCLQSWIELVTRASDADSRSETKQLFEKTISMTGVGLCRTCHTVDQLPDRSFAVNWKAEYRDPALRSFTRFAHGPHALQVELHDCSHCHKIDLTASNKESFLNVDASEALSNFYPIMKANCVSCHAEGRMSNSCTQCHNYHVGSRRVE